MKQVLKKLSELSTRSDNCLGPGRLFSVFLKLQEEMGELAQAINIPEKCSEDFRGETADVILALLDLYLMLCSNRGMTHSQAYAELEVFMSTKAAKWEDYVVMCEKALEDE